MIKYIVYSHERIRQLCQKPQVKKKKIMGFKKFIIVHQSGQTILKCPNCYNSIECKSEKQTIISEVSKLPLQKIKQFNNEP